jgi:hypothetical protein
MKFELGPTDQVPTIKEPNEWALPDATPAKSVHYFGLGESPVKKHRASVEGSSLLEGSKSAATSSKTIQAGTDISLPPTTYVADTPPTTKTKNPDTVDRVKMDDEEL